MEAVENGIEVEFDVFDVYGVLVTDQITGISAHSPSGINRSGLEGRIRNMAGGEHSVALVSGSVQCVAVKIDRGVFRQPVICFIR